MPAQRDQIVHVYHHFPPGFIKLAREFVHTQREILAKVNHMSAASDAAEQALDNLTEKVEATKGVADSAITLLNGLEEQIRALATDIANADPKFAAIAEKATALADGLAAKNQELADAVVENSDPND